MGDLGDHEKFNGKCLWVVDNLGMGTSALNMMALGRTFVQSVRELNHPHLTVFFASPLFQRYSGAVQIEPYSEEGVAEAHLTGDVATRVGIIRSDLKSNKRIKPLWLLKEVLRREASRIISGYKIMSCEK